MPRTKTTGGGEVVHGTLEVLERDKVRERNHMKGERAREEEGDGRARRSTRRGGALVAGSPADGVRQGSGGSTRNCGERRLGADPFGLGRRPPRRGRGTSPATVLLQRTDRENRVRQRATRETEERRKGRRQGREVLLAALLAAGSRDWLAFEIEEGMDWGRGH